jgi:hypothetical protein
MLMDQWRSSLLAPLAATSVALLTFTNVDAQRVEPPPPSAEKQAMIDLGVDRATARELYETFRSQAGGGDSLAWSDVPDWSGVWTRDGNIFFFDQDQGAMNALPPAKLTPEFRRQLIEKLDNIDKGIEYDPLSAGNPAGMPRWLSEPFLRDFAVTPTQTWLINEMMNEVRRIYTDGRDHPSAEDAYPLWQGDSIGFWDDGRLVIHTEQMRSGQYQRIQPAYSEEVEVVEIWEKVDETTLNVDVWVYDPPALAEPWYVRQVYKKLSNDDQFLRIRYWQFNENQNNDVIVNDEGTSDFSDLTFTTTDDK